MANKNGVVYGVTGGRGATGCSWFHENVPGPDGFCGVCRPPPDHPTIKRAEEWMRKHGFKGKYGTKEWRTGLDAWHEGGRP